MVDNTSQINGLHGNNRAHSGNVLREPDRTLRERAGKPVMI